MLIYLQMIDDPSDRSKFEHIYERYCHFMFHIAFKVLDNKEDAEDVVHDAFLSIAENISKFSTPECPETRSYIAILVEHKAIDFIRKKKRHPALSLEEVPELGIEIPYDGNDELVSCILKLPVLQRQIIWLKYLYGYNLLEISKFLGISFSNAAKADQRAKKKLRKLYEEGGKQL